MLASPVDGQRDPAGLVDDVASHSVVGVVPPARRRLRSGPIGLGRGGSGHGTDAVAPRCSGRQSGRAATWSSSIVSGSGLGRQASASSSAGSPRHSPSSSDGPVGCSSGRSRDDAARIRGRCGPIPAGEPPVWTIALSVNVGAGAPWLHRSRIVRRTSGPVTCSRAVTKSAKRPWSSSHVRIAAVSEREAGEARPPLSFGSSAAKRAEELGSRLCGCVVRRDPYRAGDGPVGVNPSCPCGG